MQVEPVRYDDNTAVVALIGGSSEAGPGLFGLLAEECVVPKGPTPNPDPNPNPSPNPNPNPTQVRLP